MAMRIVAPIEKIISVIITIGCLSGLAMAQEPWKFKKTEETGKLTENVFSLMAAVDINQNGVKELVVTDFGKFGDHIGEWKRNGSEFNLWIMEWGNGKLNERWRKRWERKESFRANAAEQFAVWKMNESVLVETIPPYLGVNWNGHDYILKEQETWTKEKPTLGSFFLSFINSSCYFRFASQDTYPRECLLGLRDFYGNGKQRIVTLLKQELREANTFKQTIRVRKLEADFPIEWEHDVDLEMGFVPDMPVNQLNHEKASKLMMYERKNRFWYILSLGGNGEYRLAKTKIRELMPISVYDLFDVKLRSTQNKELDEYWGYDRKAIPNPERNEFLLRLARVVLNPNQSGFAREDIKIHEHEEFLGVGYFQVEDIDSDGVDEVILLEETGIKIPGNERFSYDDTKDFIHILKWNGSEYQTMWISPPYYRRGSKFLIDDIKKMGKKQLVVLTSSGTIQIWEKQ